MFNVIKSKKSKIDLENKKNRRNKLVVWIVGLFLVLLWVGAYLIQDTSSGFYYTVTEFESVSEQRSWEFINGLNGKQSKIYSVDVEWWVFKESLLAISEVSIVWHDMCKSSSWELFSVWWEFKHTENTAQFAQVDPAYVIERFPDEVRVRDCVAYTDKKWKDFIVWVTHGVWKIFLYDIDMWQIVSVSDSKYEWMLNGREYDDITMNHEIVSADLDNDGVTEFYTTPSTKNVPPGQWQNWRIFQTKIINGELRTKNFIDFEYGEHAKEVHPISFNGVSWILSLVAVSPKNKIQENLQNDERRDSIVTSGKWLLNNRAVSGKWMLNALSKDREITYTELRFYYLEGWKAMQKVLATHSSFQCRVAAQWNLWYSDEDIVIWCNEGWMSIYTPNKDTLELKDSISFKAPVLSLEVWNFDNTSWDEIILWVNGQGLYYYDPKDLVSLEKIFDYSEGNNWVWSIEIESP